MFGLGSSSAGSVVTYTVHEKPHPAADRVDRADELEFVKDGFSWLTALVPPVGLIAQSLWLALAAYIAAMTAIVTLLSAVGADDMWVSIFAFAIGVFFGLEASTFKRWDLERQGYTTLGVVNGASLEDCERRFFSTWLPDQPVIAAERHGHHGGLGSHGSDAAAQSAGRAALWSFGRGSKA